MNQKKFDQNKFKVIKLINDSVLILRLWGAKHDELSIIYLLRNNGKLNKHYFCTVSHPYLCIAKGNQGPEGIHQDHEERATTPPKSRKNHH